MSNQYKRYRKSKMNKSEKSLSNLYLLPVLFIIAIVPLIVFAKLIEIDGLEAIYWKGGTLHIDFFHYYKSMYFIAASYIGGLILLVLYWLKKLKFIKTKYYMPLGIYTLFVIISAIFADDVDVALRGYIEMFQGVFVLIGYVLFVITIINLVREEKHIKAIVGSFIFVSLIIGFIGVGQYFGYDIFKTEFGRLLILPEELHALGEGLEFLFAEFAVYATLYNTNFVGSFAALMIPLSFALYFYQKKIIYIVLSILFVGLMVFIGVGSNSRAGILGVAVALILIGILFRKEVIRKPFHIVIPFIVLIIVGYGLNVASGGRVVDEIKNISFTKDIGIAQEIADNTIYLEKMIFDYYTMEILTEEQDLHIEFISNELYFSTLEGEPLEVIKEGQRITFVDEAFQNFSFTRSSNNAYYSVNAYNHRFNIWLTIDGFKFQGLSGDLFIPSDPDKIEFLEGYGSLFSSRAYIWSRSVPLLKQYIVVGAGPDMFAIAFPQEDYVGKLNYMG
ncbi:MAG: oligosaccharide repeat unit polymerase, partial [Candidatus Izimaplasma sp.]|nr:oligosaccharide repeat unit polymerase [Candidatus Izimaplasma bacterium]